MSMFSIWRGGVVRLKRGVRELDRLHRVGPMDQRDGIEDV